MSQGLQQLQALLKPVTGDDAEVERQARADYASICSQGDHYGAMQMHGDGGFVVKFYQDRFDHAFFTSADRARHPYSKATLARSRIERMAWIGALIRGEVEGTECWEVLPQSGRQHPRDRILVHWQAGYVVWLQPSKQGDCFKFSSAYPVPQAELARYTRGGRMKWRVGAEKKNAP